MQKKWMVLLGAVVLSSVSAFAGVLYGTVGADAFLNCELENPTNGPLVVEGVQYQYSCMNPYTGAYLTYSPFIACAGNCEIDPLMTNVFSGPTPLNCNVVNASCYAVTNP